MLQLERVEVFMVMRAFFRNSAMVAVLLLVAALQASVLDQAKIVINRALNSPTITVRYSGASAAIAEMRVNGVSVGTRNLDVALAEGETNFTLDMGTLKEGDNEVEIRLFNRAGKLIATERKLILTEASFEAPVFIRSPKMGATIWGPVSIDVGFGKPMRNTYVSFFIDDQFKSMSNIAPFSFTWDTERETQGWHEIEAWVVDDNSQTLKTKRVKVFVDNPGGQTSRIAQPKTNPANVNTPAKPAPAAGEAKTAPVKASSVKLSAPRAGAGAMKNELAPSIGSVAGPKAENLGSAVPTSAKLMTPTGNRNAPKAEPIKIDNSATLVPIAKGTRLADIKSMSIIYENSLVKFDVEPRITNGVPLTPFRHLFEQAGGEVKWNNIAKEVDARGMGKDIWLKIGEIVAKVNGLAVSLEQAPFIERGRTIVPLSFIKDSLDVNVDYDKATGHVLITQAKKD